MDGETWLPHPPADPERELDRLTVRAGQYREALGIEPGDDIPEGLPECAQALMDLYLAVARWRTLQPGFIEARDQAKRAIDRLCDDTRW